MGRDGRSFNIGIGIRVGSLRERGGGVGMGPSG